MRLVLVHGIQPGGIDAGHVDQAVDAVETFDGILDHRASARRVGDVNRTVQGAELVRDARHLLFLNVGEVEHGAASGQGASNALPDALGGTGHHDVLSVQRHPELAESRFNCRTLSTLAMPACPPGRTAVRPGAGPGRLRAWMLPAVSKAATAPKMSLCGENIPCFQQAFQETARLSTPGSIRAGSRVTSTSMTVGPSPPAERLGDGGSDVVGMGDPYSATAHRFRHPGIVRLDEIGRLVAVLSVHEMLQRLHVT